MSVLFCNDCCSLPFPRKIHGDERKTSERASVTYKRDERARVRHKTHKLSRQPDYINNRSIRVSIFKLICLSFSPYSVKESTSTEPSKTASVSRDGIIALGVVFGTFAVAMGAFVGYLIYREKKGKPSFGPQVRIQHGNQFILLLGNGRLLKR